MRSASTLSFTVKGDSDGLQERYDAALPRIIEVTPGKPLSHIAIPSDEGIKIFDVRESEVEVTPVYRFDW